MTDAAFDPAAAPSAEVPSDPEDARWNHRPTGPVQTNPLFEWPPKFYEIFKWYRGSWLQITSISIALLIAIVAYTSALPPLENMKTFEAGWMFRIWLLNMIPQIAVAGSLHWWLYVRKSQGIQLKFDARDLSRDNSLFTFNNQVWDNIWWTLGSAMTVATAYQWIVLWAMANGYAPTVTWDTSPLWFVAWIIIIPMWSSMHFYWVHRLAHHPKLYRHVHAVHHRNINVGPWSGISNHWYENLLYFSTYFIHLIIPSHPLHVMCNIYFQQLTPAFSHAGFEKIVKTQSQSMRAGDFFHQLHHRYFECNYGTSEVPFDRWFGTYHNGKSEGTKEARTRKKDMYRNKAAR